MKHEYHIENNEIRLIPLSAEDSEKYRILRNDNDVRKNFFNADIISKEQQALWYKNYESKKSEFMFSIYINDEFAGGIGLHDIDLEKSDAEVGRIIIDKKFSGKGYGIQVVVLITKLAKQIKIKNLHAIIYSSNIASIKTFEKAGFVLSDFDEERVYMKKENICY